MKTRIYFLDNLRTFLIFLVILYHAGFTYQSAMASKWIVVDSAKNDSIGLIGLYLDIFVMSVMFFISGYFIPVSAMGKSFRNFVKFKFKRIMVPWIVAVMTLIPTYKLIFLYSRGLPQEEWFSYFHLFQRAGTDLSFFANNPSQHWLWFLPVLFLFQILYFVLSSTKLPSINISLKTAVVVIFVVGLAYSMIMAIFNLKGWSLTPLLDFQRERLLIYFMFFLLGSLCFKLKVFDTNESSKKYFIWSNVVLTVAIGTYTVTAINFLLNMIQPERNYFFISQRIDGITYYASLLMLMFSFLYILIHTFRSRFNKNNKLMTLLNANSYNVYILHMVVLGVIALPLVNLSLPVFIKYLLLAVLTFIVSNILAYAYKRWLQHNIKLKIAAATIIVVAFISVTYSASHDNPELAQEKAPDSQVSNSSQQVGLHEAVIQGNLEAVRLHIKNGSYLDEKEPSGGSTPLITAAVFGKTEIAKVLIEAGARVNLKNNEGSTALISAAFFGRLEIVEALLANGADRNIRNNAGSTALDSVIGPFETVKGVYDYFETAFGPMGLKLDQDQIRTTRPVIAKMLQNNTSG